MGGGAGFGGGWGRSNGPSPTEHTIIAMLQEQRASNNEMFERLGKLESGKRNVQPQPTVADTSQLPQTMDDARGWVEEGMAQLPAGLSIPIPLNPDVLKIITQVKEMWPDIDWTRPFWICYGELVNNSTVAFWSGDKPQRIIRPTVEVRR